MGSGLPLRGCKSNINSPIPQKFLAFEYHISLLSPIFATWKQDFFICTKRPLSSLWPSISSNGLD
jgi:hypothetical protein